MKKKGTKGYSRRIKSVASILLINFACQLVFPNAALALTSGPTQPEVQGFEPVGTTDMVDMFSGSFVYNIPLLDVEGYPVNISYHGGVTMEQEASWVGLGWNINPGVINRTVRGVPDDFNGDTLFKDIHIKPEKTIRFGVGGGLEFGGHGDPKKDSSKISVGINIGANVNVSNYKGVSCDFTFGSSVNLMGCASAGVNMGVGSQTGASIDYNAALSGASSMILGKDHAADVGINAGIGGGYSTRSGLKELNLSISSTVKYKEDNSSGGGSLMNTGGNIPIGIMRNFVPVITNSSAMNSIYGRVKVGGELTAMYGYLNANGMASTLTYNNDASRRAYGYMYLQNAGISTADILDFTRDKDGMFNKSMQFLPVPNMTYDIYSLSGQGTGGMFRPFRNDFGSVYDPTTENPSGSNSFQGEVGLGNLFEAGLDYTNTSTEATSGPWSKYQRTGTTKGFTKTQYGSPYENVYFKQGGELTAVDSGYLPLLHGETPLSPDDAMKLPAIKPRSDAFRDVRANLIYCRTAEEDTIPGVGSGPVIPSYSDPHFLNYGNPPIQSISRIGTGHFQRKKDQVSEIVQVQKDGRKFVYGIPALNNVQREVSFSVDAASNAIDFGAGTVQFDGDDATAGNSRGRDNYYSSNVTPSYAHSYLLTAELSNDYVDVTGDGVTDDDLGTYTKFNYTRTDSDYRWIAPFSGNAKTAQYNPGFWSDRLDDKASFVCGSREQWNLHSIETKNYIAEFYTSVREDAMGIKAPILNKGESTLFNGAKPSDSYSYKLDSIKLYNKHDRFINGGNAIPVKRVYFVYDYSLCPGVPNNLSGHGKLTLRKIYFSYGTSQKSMISPYQFDYDGTNPIYDLAAKDRWGDYKPNNPTFTNYEYPYVNQNDPSNDSYASAWSLTKITLPSGGVIEAQYESNDYAYVQDKPANEMFMIYGLGNSPAFSVASQLYFNNNTPCLYAYFARRQGSELPGLSFAQNYLGHDFKLNGPNCTYFNFNVQLTGTKNSYEQIKGYAHVTDIGICQNNHDYGYIKFSPVTPKGGGGSLNPVTYTALNTARYNLPQIIFPGQNPDETDFMAMLSGMVGAFNELLNIGKSPILGIMERGGGRMVNLQKSYVRLQSVGLAKNGGGQRVKALLFHDQWDVLAAGNETGAIYGKQYNYTINDPNYGTISSGVASYEPLTGGDENPFRMPVNYTVQSSVKWPPNDPVDLYQETPIGETLFPSAQVGYSTVTVASLHENEGRSSKSRDIYSFYTAKDFPVQFIATAINSATENKYGFFSQRNIMTATQGYTLIFNDMHGKPKKTEHDVYSAQTGTYNPISYQQYNYRQSGKKLNNSVPCMVFDGAHMVVMPQVLGEEADVTFDSRQKNEVTDNTTLNANLNVFLLGLFPGAIPFAFPWENRSQNEFQSAVVAKVIQQYGILDNIESYNENAKTILRNEVYDPVTGQPVVTSLTNEFHDKEYTTNIPACWVYKAMTGAYNNIGFKNQGTITVDSNYIGTLNMTSTQVFTQGDQLLVSFKDTDGNDRNTIAWVMGILPLYDSTLPPSIWGIPICNGINVLPRYPLSTPGWAASSTLTNVKVEVINSGYRNRLTENAETYTSVNNPVNTSTSVLDINLTGLIDLKAKTFCDSNTRILGKNLWYADTVNPYATGERGIWRLLSEYAYLTGRNYSGVTSRNSGLFSAPAFFDFWTGFPQPVPPCVISPYNYFAPQTTDPNWHAERTISKWSPWGKEVENIDAVGNFSTAVYGYNESLPIAVASNARQGEILSLGFEDYFLLKALPDTLGFNYFPNAFSGTTMFGSVPPQYRMISLRTNVCKDTAHTGTHSLLIVGNDIVMPLPVNHNIYSGVISKFDNYFSTSWSPAGGYRFSSANEYLPFGLIPGKDYVASYWIKNKHVVPNATDYTFPAGNLGVNVNSPSTGGPVMYHLTKKTNIIDGWMQVEARFPVPADASDAELFLPPDYYVDDIRVFPASSNMKAFVYESVNPYNTLFHNNNGKHIATLDENNFATIFEYDQEGNLIRTKKETSGGIMTVSESRSGHPKH